MGDFPADGLFEVGVYVHPAAGGDETDAVPGYDNASGRWGERGQRAVVRGREAVRAAVDAVGSGVGQAAEQLVDAVARQLPPDVPGELGVDTIQVSFGVTLAGGVQALFTAQSQSSATVTVTMSRRPPAGA